MIACAFVTLTRDSSMTGTITRLIDNEQVGAIAGEDGLDYFFSASSVRDVPFHQLALGTSVSFTPGESGGRRRAETVQCVQHKATASNLRRGRRARS